MNYEQHDTYGIYRSIRHTGPGPKLLGAETLIGSDVYNYEETDIGEIREIMLEVRNGYIAYAVLAFDFHAGMNEKLFAIPWGALTLDAENKRFLLNINKERLKNAPGFNKNKWPDLADLTLSNDIHAYYGIRPYHSRPANN